MAFDLGRVVEAAARAALDDVGSGQRQQPGAERGKGRGLSPARGFLLGAALMTAGRLVIGGRGRDMLENVQLRLVEYEERHFNSGHHVDDEPLSDEDVEDDEYAEPKGEYDDGDEPEQERRTTASGSGGRRNGAKR